MKIGNRVWIALLGGVIAIAVVAVFSARDRAARAEARVAESQRQAANDPGSEWRTPPRQTFTTSVDQLIDQYNSIAAQIDRSQLLPPKAALESHGANSKFHALRHQVSPGIYVTMEVDNATGRPFSLGLVSGSGGGKHAVSFATTLAAVGATVIGTDAKGGDVLIAACLEASKAELGWSKKTVNGFLVYCGSLNGAWMAGVAAPA